MNTSDYYPLAGRTAVRLRDDLPSRPEFCALCAKRLGRPPAVVVTLDSTGVLCRDCAQYSPCGCLAEAMKNMFVHGDDEHMILQTWKATARCHYRQFANSYPPDVQEFFDRVIEREAEENRQEFQQLMAPIAAAVETNKL